MTLKRPSYHNFFESIFNFFFVAKRMWIGMIILGLVLSFSVTVSNAETIPVGPNEAIKTIQEAIAKAQSGDVLLIKKGVYKEGNILIKKSITLKGENFPVLDGEKKYEILTVHARHVVIEGFEFKDTGTASIQDLAAIKVLDSRYVTIRNNRFTNTFFGIYFANSRNSSIENNQLQAQAEAEHQIGNGIHLWKCDTMTLTGNTIRGHRDGIYFEFVTNSTITNNYSEANLRYGLHFMFSHNDEYRNNIFKNNGAGVAVMYTKNVTMVNNLFEQNWGSSAYGLLLKDIRDSHVTHNRFIKNTVGIHLEGVSRTTFEENMFSANGYAIRLQASCDDNTFLKNNFSGNTFDMATNGSLVLNTINGNYWDKYEGYDLNKDGVGDVPFHPVSMYAMIVERIPTAVLLWRSFMVFLMDRAEKTMPVVTPLDLKDNSPYMRPHDFNY
jgi:nitrous oxidase accessory protein